MTLVESSFFERGIMKPVVTEQTSKRYKGLMLVGGLACCVGVVMIVGAEDKSTGFDLLLVGLGVYVAARFLAWWNHG